ncbi:C40 family peptidase [Burkholderiaceae bacterium UC74_6]
MKHVRRTAPQALLRQTLMVGALGLCALAARAEPTAPPAGMVMGAYGQSLQIAAAKEVAAKEALIGSTASTPATAATSADAVSRFLQEQGLVPQTDGTMLDKVRDKASGLVLSAMNFLGVRYKYGGASVENGFDCSGFTRHIFENSIGLVLPRRADEQARSSSLAQVRKEELKPGDLVFFNTMRATFSHVGIYVGDGKFVHAPRTGAAIRVDDMREAYWAKRFTGARRAEATAKAQTSSRPMVGDGG